MNKFIAYISILCVFVSCDQEVIKLKGNIKGASSSDSYLIVKMKSISNNKEQILDTIDFVQGKFEFYSKSVKPPVKLTLVTYEGYEFDVWVGEYGTKMIEGNCQPKYECRVIGSFFFDELQRVSNTYNKMYLEPIKDKIGVISKLNLQLENGVELTVEEEERKGTLEKDCKTAYRLRKRSILKTVRKNPNNPVAVALMTEEYARLTSHQKKECLKYLNKSFSDSGLNWQMKN
jgi:hypothetical protein